MKDRKTEGQRHTGTKGQSGKGPEKTENRQIKGQTDKRQRDIEAKRQRSGKDGG